MSFTPALAMPPFEQDLLHLAHLLPEGSLLRAGSSKTALHSRQRIFPVFRPRDISCLVSRVLSRGNCTESFILKKLGMSPVP